MCCESCLIVGLIINCWVLQDDIDSVLSENMNGLLVEHVGTLPLRVRKGSSLMVWAGPSAFAVMGVGKISLDGGCWWVYDGVVECNGSLQRR